MGEYMTWPEFLDFLFKLASLIFLIISCFYRHNDNNRKRYPPVFQTAVIF